MFRTCKDCGKLFDLPIPYEQANALIRDRCTDCIAKLQREHEEKMQKPQPEIAGQDWFT